MTGVENLKFAALKRIMVLVGAVLALAGCDSKERGADGNDHQDRRAATPAHEGENDAKPPPEGCTPKCGAACGVDDGCGSKCGCEGGLECKDGVCLDPACGPCRPNERCNAGKCECVPDCDGRACRDDGCGGECACPDDTVLNPQQQPVPPDQCKDTCESAHFQCGKVCGTDCGSCGDGQKCDAGVCKCAPKCDGTSCSDGCGGGCDCGSGTVCNAADSCVKPGECKDTCESTGKKCGTICGQECGTCGNGQSCIDGQCREAVSCTDCGLQIRLLERQVLSNKIVRAKIAVDYEATGEDTGPRLVDMRIGADHVVNLVEAEPGPALVQTGKDLFVDETTHRAWQEKADESYQLLAYSVSGTLRVKSGRLVTLTFDLAESGPVRFSLMRHSQTFAPLDADNALQSSTYELPLVVSR